MVITVNPSTGLVERILATSKKYGMMHHRMHRLDEN